MPKFVPLSKKDHASFFWKTPSNYRYATTYSTAPIVAEEIQIAVPVMPLAFRALKGPTNNISFQLVTLLSPLEGDNFYLNTEGAWLSGYVPAALQYYPLQILHDAESGNPVVCFDEDSGLVFETEIPGAKPFFQDSGESSEEFQRLLEVLQNYEQQRLITQKAVDALAEYKLLVPWHLSYQPEEGDNAKQVTRVFKVDGDKLQKLAAEPLHKLNQCGALMFAYAQLLSEKRIENFGKLQKIRNNVQDKVEDKGLTVNYDALGLKGMDSLLKN